MATAAYKNKDLIKYGIGALVVLILSVFFIGKALGKIKGGGKPDKVKLPGDTHPGQEGKDWSPGPVTDAVKNLIYSWVGRNVEPLSNLLELSNTQFVAVWNDWNKRYYKLDDETLKTALEGENYLPGSPLATTRAAVLNRITKLNLT